MGNTFIDITDEMIEKAESLAARGMTMEQIAYSLDMGMSTLYQKASRFLELSDAIKRGKSKGIAAISNALFEGARSGNTTAQIFYLKCRAQWREQDVLDEKEKENMLEKAKSDVQELKQKDTDGRPPQTEG